MTNFPFDFLPDKNFSDNYDNLENYLNTIKYNGYLPSFDGLKIYYEYFLCDGAKASVVIIHGLSEFTAKFYEIVNFYLNNDLNVFLYDARGHGYSGRETENLQSIHVRSYDDYVGDLEVFIDKIVKKISDLPIYFFSQSMGGAVVGLYLQKHPHTIAKSMFVVPMLCPNTHGAPRFIVRYIAKRDGKKLGKDAPFFYSRPFNPDDKFSDSSSLNENRFNLYMQKRISNKYYQTSRITNSWMEQTTLLLPKLLDKSKNEIITTKCLIVSAENDNIVLLKPQKQYAKRLKDCKFVTIKNAKHTIFASTPQIMQEFFDLMRDFFIKN